MQRSFRTGNTPPKGFTLIELMVGLTLIGILLSWGVPSFIGLYHRNLLAAHAERLTGDLHHARSEAIKRNLPVVICRSSDFSGCTSDSNSRSDWSIGWISFVNADRDKVRDDDEEILRVGESLPPQLSLHFNRWWRLTFQPDGRVGNGTFTLCDPGRNQHKLTVYLSGRIRKSAQRKASSGCPGT